jgi:hypothetical protein
MDILTRERASDWGEYEAQTSTKETAEATTTTTTTTQA